MVTSTFSRVTFISCHWKSNNTVGVVHHALRNVPETNGYCVISKWNCWNCADGNRMEIVEMYLYSEEKWLQCKWLHSDRRGSFWGEEGAENVNVHNYTFSSLKKCPWKLLILWTVNCNVNAHNYTLPSFKKYPWKLLILWAVNCNVNVNVLEM